MCCSRPGGGTRARARAWRESAAHGGLRIEGGVAGAVRGRVTSTRRSSTVLARCHDPAPTIHPPSLQWKLFAVHPACATRVPGACVCASVAERQANTPACPLLTQLAVEAALAVRQHHHPAVRHAQLLAPPASRVGRGVRKPSTTESRRRALAHSPKSACRACVESGSEICQRAAQIRQLPAGSPAHILRLQVGGKHTRAAAGCCVFCWVQTGAERLPAARRGRARAAHSRITQGSVVAPRRKRAGRGRSVRGRQHGGKGLWGARARARARRTGARVGSTPVNIDGQPKVQGARRPARARTVDAEACDGVDAGFPQLLVALVVLLGEGAGAAAACC